MPNCREIQNIIDTASARSELAPNIEQHLGNCDGCREHASSTFQLRSLLMAQPRVEAPSDFDFRLRARIARARDEQRGWRWALSQFWENSFSWKQAGAAAMVLMAMTISGAFYLTRDQQTPSTEIAKAQVVATPQTVKEPGAPSTSLASGLAAGVAALQPTAVNRDKTTLRPGLRFPVNAAATTVVSKPTLETEVARLEIPSSQEILVYQPGQSGKPAGSRSIVVPRRGQVSFGAQLASVRDVSTRPAQSAIETF